MLQWAKGHQRSLLQAAMVAVAELCIIIGVSHGVLLVHGGRLNKVEL